jgi:hypothetical protein
LCLNNRELTGRITISAEDAMVKDGVVNTPAPVSNPDAAQPAIQIDITGIRTQLNNLTVLCQSLTDRTSIGNGINGRLGITNSADDVKIEACQVQAGNRQGIMVTQAGPFVVNNTTGAGGQGIVNSGNNTQITHCIVTAGNSGQLFARSTGSDVSV